MQHNRHSMLSNLFLFAGIGLFVGFVFGYPAELLSAGLLTWSLLQVKQFSRLNEWLHRDKSDAEPPECTGHWGDLFDDFSRQQKRTASREAFLRSVIKRFQQSSAALHDAVVIINDQNNLEWWNRSAERLLGFKTTTDRGKPVINLLRDPRFIRYYKRDSYEEPLQLPSPVNHEIELQYQITRFGKGDRLLVARDITQMLRLEQTRQDFVANASHELRTPLTVILGYLETFLDQELPRPLHRGMTQMQQQARRMQNLVSDLLLLSRLEATRQVTDEHPVQIQSLIQNIHDAATELARGKGHEFELDLDPQHDLLGQEVELHSAFSNLVYNAVRYTRENGRISIRWWVDQEGGHFSVTDNGIGIDAIHISRLTERFYRVDESRSSESGGTGLGLAIVKHVLSRHGGHLTIKSKKGEGSTFTCHFPLDHLMLVSVSEDDDLQDAG
ncbi:phosphate regulon sensor histidine kinase PhoR [Pontibacterium granulatum]|uniref:phosphate regulon sensor histidine kinase PhoR n=1 Tax=Pontibacterium granulatum TaxID=2036029 RepID=UPI00249B2B26|nr:phosphate regulon sensor histidine kinase PhoR [Pontibacterium granulatum]MDI3326154.1 phosphate regulon sensor histidine kinase PhoR [Pontibacterium granulatum]